MKNFWIKKNHKRQQDLLIGHLLKRNATMGFNLYSRSTHSIEVFVGSETFWLVRTGSDWLIRDNGQTQTLPALSDPGVWKVLDDIVDKKYAQQIPSVIKIDAPIPSVITILPSPTVPLPPHPFKYITP